MARSTFYYHASRLSEPDKYAGLRGKICRIFSRHEKRYGYRRVTYELLNNGDAVNHKTVQKLMSEMGLRAKVKKAKYKSYKGEVGRVAPNVIDRNFVADRPNQKWTTDVTEVKIKEQKLYLSPILDMFNGEIVSYAISTSPNHYNNNRIKLRLNGKSPVQYRALFLPKAAS